jgi:HK97 family phage major capsid protein
MDQAKLTARKLAALGRFSSELNEDSIINIGNMLAEEAALTFAVAEDSAVFLGDGTSAYGRVVGLKSSINAGSTVTAATGHTSFDTLTDADFTNVIAKVQTYAIQRRNAKWYISRAGWAASMQRLALAAGGVTSTEMVNGVPTTVYKGFPVVWVEVMNSTLTPQTSTSGLCYFGDLRLTSKFGDRRGMSMAVSNDVYFTTDEIAIRFTERYDFTTTDPGTESASGGIVMLSTPGS